MRGAMPVAMVVMIVIMAAAATLAMGVVMLVLVLMRMIVTMVLMIVVMTMVMTMVVVMMGVPAAAIVAMSVVVDLRLGLERALDRRHRTALPAHQLGKSGIVGHIERLGRHFRRNVMAAEVPGKAHQPQRVFGTDFQQAFRRGLDLHKSPVLQLQRVAVVQRRRLVEGDREFQAAHGRHSDAVDPALTMAEAQRIDNALGTDGGLAKDGSGAKHIWRSHG
ncbi:conserved hypothetical protein [Hyphomicrobiales bacterium]|nr:conserved hypothetical protein [Hyphomicrobiales bacterium]